MSDRKYAYPLILNKVASPRYATPTLRRARLIEWLNAAASGRATVIAADAGYGKTTLLWQWEREVEFPCYWYKVDRNDRDWTLHISYLAESIAKRHPGFGRRTHSMLEQMGGPGSSRPGVTAYLLAEMHKRLTEPCTFIIDDWHYVNAVTEVRGLWNQILRDAPGTCRFVFASRVKPMLRFARFKTHGGYAELRTDALRFTETEIEELFRDIYRDPLEPAQVAELERRTEGWAASLQLVEVSLRERHTPEDRQSFISSITATKDSDLFDFLAEEVLDQQPEETRNFLLSTSILQQITPEVAERLTGSHDGRRELTALEQRGLFTNRLDEVRYRYHNLFREFLERRLVAERSDAEVVGLHIHAASYFETTEQWPEAIHHYLRAGLQRQAARLIAKYGEDVVSEGRLGLVDEWLRQLPDETIRQNARLSLLFGEATGIRGDWDRALEALERARAYFARKGDRRLEALACLKLSTVHANFGDPMQAADVAQSGLQLVPEDAVATRLRLEGNLAITRTWMSSSLEEVSLECVRIAASAASNGLDHFAAIGHHNAGVALMLMGRFAEAVEHLSHASAFWADIPTNPFADNSDLVSALLAVGDVERARAAAEEAVRKTAPWPRPHADARFGLAQVLLVDGRYDDAIDALERARSNAAALGALHGPLLARLIEAYFLGHRPELIPRAIIDLASRAPDPRYHEETAPARAFAKHCATACKGECMSLSTELDTANAHGAHGTYVIGRVKLGVLSFEHTGRKHIGAAWAAVAVARDLGIWRLLRPWLRLYAAHAATAIRTSNGAALVAQLAAFDPDAWRVALPQCLPEAVSGDRQILLRSIARTANRDTIATLERIPGEDVAEIRRELRQLQAPRLFLRSLGTLSIHRGDWNGPSIPVDKKRARSLLAVLVAHQNAPLTREMALEILWPDSDPESAINSLNQTVFQLRRYLEAKYRGGESPEYILSTAEQVSINPELVYTDVAEITRLPARLSGLDWQHRQATAQRAIQLVRGEFLADLRYEDWVSRQQMMVHARVRERLLPIAQDSANSYAVDVAAQAASALLLIDPFDEAALISLAECMHRSGRRAAAQQLVAAFARRMASDLDIEPSPQLLHAAGNLGVVKQRLTARRDH